MAHEAIALMLITSAERYLAADNQQKMVIARRACLACNDVGHYDGGAVVAATPRDRVGKSRILMAASDA